MKSGKARLYLGDLNGVLSIRRVIDSGKHLEMTSRMVVDHIKSELRAGNMTNGRDTIAYFGEPASWAHIAAIHYFEGQFRCKPMKEPVEMLSAVLRGEVKAGVLPVYNNTVGLVSAVYNSLIQTEAKIVGEIILGIKQCLIANSGTRLKRIARVYSHEQALCQSSEYLNRLGAEKIICGSTSEAVKRIKEGRIDDAAAVASEIAAEVYEMRILKENINTERLNATTFLIMGPIRMSEAETAR